MLDFQLQQAPFRYGLAEGTDPHQVPIGTLTTLENGVWKTAGRIEKRFGTTALPATGATEGRRLFTRGDELCLADALRLYTYSPARAAWHTAGAVPSVGATWSTLIDASTGLSASDVGISAGGLAVHAWITGDPQGGELGELRAQIRDATTGAVLHTTRELTDAAFGVRVLVIGTTAILLTRTLAATPFAIRAYTINLTTFATSAGVNLRTDVAQNGAFAGWDACAVGDTFVVAYNRTGNTLALESYTTALASAASGTVVDASGCTMVSVAGTVGESLWVFYSQATIPARPRLAVNNPATLAAVTAPVTVEITPSGSDISRVGVCRYDAGNCVVTYDLRTATVVNRMTSFLVNNAGTVGTATRRDTYWARPVSRPFMLGTKCYAVVSCIADSAVSSSFGAINSALVEVEVGAHAFIAVPHLYVAAVEPILGGFWPKAAPLTSATGTATSLYLSTPFQADAITTLAAAAIRQGARLQRFAIGVDLPADLWRSVATPYETYFVAAHLAAYDGRSVFDYGFFRDPWPATLTTLGIGGLIAAGTYLYSAVYEYRSAAGILHRSPAMVPTTQTTTGATSSNALAVASCSLSTKESATLGFGNGNDAPQTASVYRTTVGGSTPQRLSFEPTYNRCGGSTGVSSSSLTDTRADANISVGSGITPLGGRPALYTTGGILDDYQPPASVTMFAHADRLWCLAGDLRTWWFSKAFQDDLGVAPGFNPQFRIGFAEAQVCGASMDDKALFFSATGVSYLQGLGPAANGQNSDFGVPIKIQTDVGCVNPRSVVSMPDGVMFESARGLYLLTRGLELVWIGRDVKDTLAAYPNITSAVVVAKHNQVRFTANADSGNNGIVLVFDYVARQWSTSKYTNGSTYGMPFGDACIWQGEWTFVTLSGAVYQESSTTYLDAGTAFVPMTLETAWISAGGPVSFQSVRNFLLNGTSHTDHNLTVDVGFDGETSYVQTKTFAAGSAVTSVGVEECEVSIGTRRKCSYIRFRIADATPTTGTLGTGRGPAFEMMGLEVGMKRGFGNVPAAKKG